MKWFNKNKTVMVETAAIEFYCFHNYKVPELHISMYGNNKVICGDDADELYECLLKEYK